MVTTDQEEVRATKLHACLLQAINTYTAERSSSTRRFFSDQGKKRAVNAKKMLDKIDPITDPHDKIINLFLFALTVIANPSSTKLNATVQKAVLSFLNEEKMIPHSNKEVWEIKESDFDILAPLYSRLKMDCIVLLDVMNIPIIEKCMSLDMEVRLKSSRDAHELKTVSPGSSIDDVEPSQVSYLPEDILDYVLKQTKLTERKLALRIQELQNFLNNPKNATRIDSPIPSPFSSTQDIQSLIQKFRR